MKLTIISTIGASLIRNYALSKNENPAELLESIDKMDGAKLKEMENELYLFISKGVIPGAPPSEELKSTCAELSSIFRIINREVSDEIDEIVLCFVISDTPQGKLVYNTLERFFQEKYRDYRGIPIKVYYDVASGLTYVDAEHVSKGLPSVPVIVSRWIRNMQDVGKVALNVTAGFKAECIYAAFVGILSGIPTYYIHEKFRDVIRLPPLPEKLILREEDLKILLHFVEKFYQELKDKGKKI